ncbi:polymorphic toxin-type HINT domain-containing protein, partial [Streptomyces sp. NPDC060333]|uniref:polymorphic toxin-type HINT domain-containing protein n=1 Tax=Streptomyces sp. NPDC060333 TaxID=3347098 RepID=UPI00365CFACA
AAARARAAAAEATAHAARANAAANKAEAAAFAANAAANKAEAQAAATHAAAQRANQKAAEATAQEARAGIAAHEAGRLAGLAAMAANNSYQAANRTKEEAQGAVREAAMARLQSTIAVKASDAARSTAAGIADPANTAIALTAPFAGKDVDADFAAEVAAAAEQMGAEQVTAAEAKAAEAVKAAEAAETAAKGANAQVAPAFKAAADAARSSANAARSAAAAMRSAAQAAEDGAKARTAAARANQADAQAQTDAKLAREAANRAFADATAARNAANQAEAEASRARGAAAEADSHAVAANSAANLAEHEASVAQGAAAQAEKDAADANKFAESADGHAKSAEAAAKNANTYAREADEAAKKAEEYELEQQRKAREAAAKDKGGDYHLKLTDEEIAALKAIGITPEQFEMARQLRNKGFLDFLVENGGQIIVDLLFEDIKNCFEKPNFEDCFWAAVGALPWGKALKIIKEMPAIAKALKRIVTGLNDFLDKSAEAKKLMAKGEEVLEKLRKKNPPCMTGKKHSFAPGTPVLMADGTNKPIQDIRVGEQVLATDPETGKTAGRAVTHLIVGEGDKNLRELTIDTDGTAGQATGTITATDIHPFWVENRHTWVDAADLKTGDRLRTPEGELKELIGLRAWTERIRVHNLTVDDLHTYYVLAGATPVLVHNCGVGSADDAMLALDRAEELNSTRGYNSATTAVIGVFNSKTKKYSIRIGINGDAPQPASWVLRPGEEFARGGIGTHAEENILNSLASHEHPVFGAASRNFCVDRCSPMLGEHVYGLTLGGRGFRGHQPQNSPYTIFWGTGD